MHRQDPHRPRLGYIVVAFLLGFLLAAALGAGFALAGAAPETVVAAGIAALAGAIGIALIVRGRR